MRDVMRLNSRYVVPGMESDRLKITLATNNKVAKRINDDLMIRQRYCAILTGFVNRENSIHFLHLS